MTRLSWPLMPLATLQTPARHSSRGALALALGLGLHLAAAHAAPGFPNYPITPQQKATAGKIAEAGVPLSELAPNAPDSYTVKRGDTLWDISKLFLKSPWRWPELWGMNMEQIRNPHLIYPGQILYLDKSNGRARLRLAKPVGGVVKLSPRVRDGSLDDPISSVSVHLLEPFFNQAVILDSEDAMRQAPRIVATQEGRVVVSTGETAYVRGDLGNRQHFQVYREPKPLLDPTTNEVLGYEAVFVGKASVTQLGKEEAGTEKRWFERSDGMNIVPSTITITGIRLEAGVGDRLAPVPPHDFEASAPHAPQGEMSGQVVSIYGEALTAGQNQIVSLNRGRRDGLERGHVLALWRAGTSVQDKTDPNRITIRLPDERQGMLYVFRVFDKMSYALILTSQDPIKAGDRFTQP